MVCAICAMCDVRCVDVQMCGVMLCALLDIQQHDDVSDVWNVYRNACVECRVMLYSVCGVC